MASSFTRFLDHTQRRTTVGRTPLDEWSARRRDHYLTTHNSHNRQTSMPPVRFEPTISVGKRPQTYALDRAATGTGLVRTLPVKSEQLTSNRSITWSFRLTHRLSTASCAEWLDCRMGQLLDWSSDWLSACCQWRNGQCLMSIHEF